jgi:hypothetical protein
MNPYFEAASIKASPTDSLGSEMLITGIWTISLLEMAILFLALENNSSVNCSGGQQFQQISSLLSRFFLLGKTVANLNCSSTEVQYYLRKAATSCQGSSNWAGSWRSVKYQPIRLPYLSNFHSFSRFGFLAQPFRSSQLAQQEPGIFYCLAS